jgi:hypothetical protein
VFDEIPQPGKSFKRHQNSDDPCIMAWDHYIKGIITFQWFLSYKNSWNKKKIARWLEKREEIREALWGNPMPIRNPTPIRSMQLCYSCKVPWEPDHRCRGKGKKHTIEVHHDSDDGVCVDGATDVDSEQSDDDSDSCTGASDSDSTSEDNDDEYFTGANDACTLEEDDDPCVVDRQLDG